MENIDTVDSALSKIGIGYFQFIQLALLCFVHSCNLTILLSIAFLGPLLNCSWKITHVQESMLTMSFCLGMIIGSSALGAFCDKYGRKSTLILSNSGLIIFGIVSSISSTIHWLYVIRLIIGIFIGGTSASIYALLTEFTPTKFRGAFVIALQFSRAFSTILITTFGFLIVPQFGWRGFLSGQAVLIMFALLALNWVPESPRYLALHNQKEKSLEIINKIAKMNRSEYIYDIHETKSTNKSSFQDLIHSNYLSTTIYTGFLSFVCGLYQYCIIMLITIINAIPHRCLEDLSKYSTISHGVGTTTVDYSCCFLMTWTNYKNLYISSIGEFIAVPISIFLITFIGRKTLMAIYFFITSVVTFLLNFCLGSLELSIVFFILRGAINGLLILAHIYNAEVFPTSVRSTGVGVCSSCSRFGGLISPLIINLVVIEYSYIGGITLLSLLSFLSVIVCFLLPYETKDRQLYQTVDHDEATDKSKFQQNSNYQTIKRN